MSRCAVCGETAGGLICMDDLFQRVTYQGAPVGGVPVHGHCLNGFFEDLERQQWKRDVAEARPDCFT
jgi:hypothetical protein